MEAEAKYTYVGVAVLALIAALVVSVVWLKRTGAERDFARFTIYFQEQALDGLAVGSDVDMRGIKVGRVLDYGLSPDRVNRVRVDVRIDRQAPVLENTVAVVTRNFVTGIAQITLVTREPPGPPLTIVPANEKYPVIAEGRSDLLEIAGKVTQLGEMAGEALSNLNRMFTTENREAVAQTVQNVRNLTANMNARLVGLEKTLHEIDGAAREFRRTADRVAVAAERVGTGANEALADARLVLGDVRGVVADAQRTVQQATRAIDSLQTQAGAMSSRIDASATNIDDQLSLAVGELRGSLDAIQRSLDRLNDPRAALLGPTKSQLGPGEKLP